MKIMWRIALFIGLMCSVSLNVYLLMQLNIRGIEDKFQQQTNVNLSQGAIRTKTANLEDKIKGRVKQSDKDKGRDSESTEGAKQLVNNIKKAINAKDYFNASSLIHTLANDYQAELAKVKLFWLQDTKVLIKQRLYIHAEDSINAYLAFQGDDSDFLYQQVDFYWQQQENLLAIKHAYEVQYHAFNDVEIADVLKFARVLVQQQVDAFTKNNHWQELRSFLQEVLIYDPQSQKLQWLLVRAQYQLGEFDYALNTIEPLLNQPNYKVKAQALLAKIEAALREPQSIPLRRQGEHFIVQGVMNDTFDVSLMLDTGASISLLSQPAFEALSLFSEVAFVEDVNFSTAGGRVRASIYQVAEFAIQGYIVNDFVFAVSPSFTNGSEENDGLLGMNFLKAFDFHIDQNNNRLILKNK